MNAVLKISFICLLMGFLIYLLVEQARQFQAYIKLQKVKSYYENSIQEQEKNKTINEKIACGYTSDLDISVDALEYMKFVGYSEPLNPKQHSTIDTIDQLIEMFSYNFIAGSAKEVHVNNEQMFLQLVANISKIKNLQDLGGNGAMIAHSAYLAGAKILLGANLDQQNFQDLFNQNITLANNLTDELDIHIVFNFFEDKGWGGVYPKRSNRFYVNFDKMAFNDMSSFHQKNLEFMPDIFVIGGLQLLYGPQALEKISNISSYLSLLKNKTKIHLEMASFTNQTIVDAVLSDIISKCDSLGFNEQEMGQMLAMINGEVNSTKMGFDSKIEVNQALQSMTNLIQKYQKFNISRFHLHTLKSQVICHNKQWESPELALMKSITMALQTAYTLLNKEIDPLFYDFSLSDLELNYPDNLVLPVQNSQPINIAFNLDNPINCWDMNSDYHCCVAPNIITDNALRYRTQGDHITGISIAYHKISKFL